MDIQDVQFVGNPCGQHGAYTFYKAFRYSKNGEKRIMSLSEFFFVQMYRDSDLLCIGELQLLWFDKNSENMLASLRLYFLPENTPEGRMAEHGEDEVLAISEKVVIRLDDLVTWITVKADWSFGRLAKCEADVTSGQEDRACNEDVAPPKKSLGYCFGLVPTLLDFSDVENERLKIEEVAPTGSHVIILSFPKYCRYRAVMKRLEGVENKYLKMKIVNTLGGFYVKYPNTRVLFCKDTFEYPDIEGHEMLCNHLAPKLKGRPRGRRKKNRSVSPGSESNESESSVTVCSNSVNIRPIRILEKSVDKLSDSPKGTRRSTRTIENNENKKFMKTLTAYMKTKQLSMGRVPSLGYKELNLHEFFTKVQKLGGYDSVTKNRLWKSIFEDITGLANSTSAATIVRRHYERFLLSYERHLKGEDHRPLPVSERKRLKKELKRKRGISATNNKHQNSTDEKNESLGEIKSLFAAKKHPADIENENKNHNSQGKTISLRHIRVKPERQKDKLLHRQTSTELDKERDIMKISEAKSDVKPEGVETIEEKNETSLEIEDISIPKIETDEKSDQTSVVANDQLQIEGNDQMPIVEKVEENLNNKENVRSIESPPLVQIEPIDKNSEPITTAIAPVVQIPEKSTSPVEGKENIPISTSHEATLPENDSTQKDIIPNEEPIKSNSPNLPDSDVKTDKEFKKVKLDILRNQGLEVTPIKALAGVSISKDIRPSVIQSCTAKSLMPPPGLPKKINVSITPANLATKPMKSPSTPVKDFKFLNGGTPPKVVQSKSIYSYSERTVYGNPKDIFHQPAMAPRLPNPNVHRLTGGNPIDLSVTSPQKPMLEITPMPQSSNSVQSLPSRISVAKNLYKNDDILEGRRLGSNLEITLVGPNRRSQTIKSAAQKRPSGDAYANKMARLKVNEPSLPQSSKYSVQSLPRNSGYSASTSRYSSSTKSDARPNHSMQSSSSGKPSMMPPTVPPPFAESGGNNGVPGFLPPLGLDNIYAYQAAIQSLYSNMPNVPSLAPPMLPLPTPEQLKFYADLMAHNRMTFPFLSQNGVNNSHSKNN